MGRQKKRGGGMQLRGAGGIKPELDAPVVSMVTR